MAYKVTDIVKDVRVALDSNSESAALLDVKDVSTLQLDELIESKILDAARFVLTHARNYLLGMGDKVADAAVTWKGSVGNGSGVINLPDNFLRLVTFQMSDWAYPVTELITADSPLYAQQHSRYAGVRGCPQRPVAALVSTPDGQAIEFFSCSEGATAKIKALSVVTMPELSISETESTLAFPVKLYDALKYATAYLVAVTLEMPTAKFYIETAKSYLE